MSTRRSSKPTITSSSKLTKKFQLFLLLIGLLVFFGNLQWKKWISHVMQNIAMSHIQCSISTVVLTFFTAIQWTFYMRIPHYTYICLMLFSKYQSSCKKWLCGLITKLENLGWRCIFIFRFRPPDACYIEVMRFRIRPPKARELPMQARCIFEITGNKVSITVCSFRICQYEISNDL